MPNHQRQLRGCPGLPAPGRPSIPTLFGGEPSMATTTTNGEIRKTLASQLDRLDSILDGLSEGLNEAVATAVEGAVERAVRQAVGQAVKETLQAVTTEAETNPAPIPAFRDIAAAPPASPPNPTELPKGLFRRTC